MAAAIYTVIAASIYLFISLMILSFFICIHLYFCAFYQHFTILVREIDNTLIEDSEDPSIKHHKKEPHAKRKLRDTIQFDIFAKK